MKKSILAALMILTTFGAHAEEITGKVNLPKGALSELAQKGAEFAAIKEAQKACSKRKKRCGFVKTETIGGKVIATMKVIDFSIKDQGGITVQSGEYFSTAKFTARELDGIVMKTLEAALAECRYYSASACEIVEYGFKKKNVNSYVNEWNEAAFLSEITLRVRAVTKE